MTKPNPDTWKAAQRTNSGRNVALTVTDSAGASLDWMILGSSATINLPLIMNSAAGSIKMPIISKVLPGEVLENRDALDIEIAAMSREEQIALVLNAAGMWADRDDLDELMDRSDRIDELYAPYTSDDPDPSL